MAISLPTSKQPAITQDPKNLIVYGAPKIGKTSLLVELPENLVIDLENGSDYVPGLKIKARNIRELKEIFDEIKKAGCPYKFITLDTITALEDMCKPLALQLYKNTPLGKNFEGTDILSLPMGAGQY